VRASKAYLSLRDKDRRFIERNPQLLVTGWVYSDSCVCQVMAELRTPRRRNCFFASSAFNRPSRTPSVFKAAFGGLSFALRFRRAA
jgi:hypothetical protein